MKKQNVYYFTLEGSYEDLGRQLAKCTQGQIPKMPAPEAFSDKELAEALALYQAYCPGIVEELKGYAAERGVGLNEIAYTWMTYLKPYCSGLIVSPERMRDGQPRLIRNYEFGLAEEDFMVFETRPRGKYAHIGGSVALFGRTEGINEKGLAVAMSSCGFPVSNLPGMRPPKLKGLQFWAVIRTLLENCKNADEALTMVKEMPIAYNINLYLADDQGQAYLVETMDGAVAVQPMDKSAEKPYLRATNHIVIPELRPCEPFAMRNSVRRLEALDAFVGTAGDLTEDMLKSFFLKPYPEGMTSSYYSQWFGTIKTVVMNPCERSFDICWLGHMNNGWDKREFGCPVKAETLEKYYSEEAATPDFFENIPL